MTRQESIKQWKNIVTAVVHASAKLKDVWEPQFRDAQQMNEQERAHIADRYLEAVATEIVSESTNEELAEL